MKEFKCNTIISFSCYDPVGNQGGVSKVVRGQEKLLIDRGYSYILFFPIAKVKIKYFGMCVDGIFQKLICENEIYNIIKKIPLAEIHIHHLSRMNILMIQHILECRSVPIKFFVHDFYTVCPTFNFINSSGNYCGIEPISDSKCHYCLYYEKAKKHKEALNDFFGTIQERLTVIAPSTFAMMVWDKTFTNLKCKKNVVKLQVMDGLYSGNKKKVLESEKLKVAFIGKCNRLKGYPQWQIAVDVCKKKELRYQFYVFGDEYEEDDTVQPIEVNVSKNPNDMVDKLRMEDIDIAVLNSICGETYSYTYHEAYAANCFMITSVESGNIAICVNEHKNGIVMDSPDCLSDILSNEQMMRVAVNKWKMTANGPLNLRDNTQIAEMISASKTADKTPMDAKAISKIDLVEESILTVLYKVMRRLKKRGII